MSRKQRSSSTPHRLTRSSNVLPSPGVHYPIQADRTPLDETLLPSVVELNDSLVDLDSNLQSLQSIQESLVSFNESFSSFLYGLQINAYTVEFNELPGLNDATIQRNEEVKEKITKLENFFYERGRESNEGNETYMTNDEDGSFLVQPTKRKSTAAPSIRDHRDSRKSRIPVGRRVATKSDTSSARGTAPGGVLKPTVASERRQRPPVQNNTRPPFR